MRRTRAVSLTALAAAGALVLAACSGTPGQSSGDTTAATAAESSAAASGETTAPSSGGGEGAGNVGEVGGSACGAPHGPWEEPANPGGEVRVAWNDPPLSFNNNTTHSNSVAAGNIQYFTNLQFAYFDQEINYVNNDSFGTCTLDSLDPLTVTYTINEGVSWSDGTPVTAADLVLSWGAQSGVFNDETANVVVDEATGESTVVAGAGVAFDKVDPSISLIKEFPTISEDNRSATFVWSAFYVDYQFANPATSGTAGTLVPAHVVGKNALKLTDNAEAAQAVVDAFKDADKAKLKPIADFWNTGFDADQLPPDPELYLATGPYKVTSYAQRANLTFEKMEGYDWGPKPALDKISYSIIGDPTAAVQALTNEEIDVISPQVTADIAQAVSALADRGIESKPGDGGTYEHVDLVFANGGPFDPATYGGDAEKALKVRQAFLMTIPRQDIVDRLIKPINPEAVLRGSYTTVPGSPRYDDIVEANGMNELYGTVDIPGAQALLTEAAVTTPVDVRLLFADNNPRRSNEYDLMKASAQQAGFNIIDGRSASWGQELPAIDKYDASLFGWQSTSTGIVASQPQYETDGASNYGLFSSDVVDEAFAQMASTPLTEDGLTEQLVIVETELVDQAFGITIYQFPNVVSWNGTRVTGVSDMPLAPGVFFNFWEWEAVG